jgi:hypothetical protein
MRKWLVLLLILPTICNAGVNPPWEAFYGPDDSWSSGRTFSRLSVPHGWIVHSSGKSVASSNIMFVADENHEWVLDASLTNSLVKPK